MNKLEFLSQKNKLVVQLTNNFCEIGNDPEYETNQNILLSILSQYTYDNRLKIKGLLSHTIIDNLEIDQDIADAFIKFDRQIN